MTTKKSAMLAILGALAAAVTTMLLGLAVLLSHPRPFLIETGVGFIPFNLTNLWSTLFYAMRGGGCDTGLDRWVGIECRILPITKFFWAGAATPPMAASLVAIVLAGLVAGLMAMGNIYAHTPKRESARTIRGFRPIYDADARSSLRSAIAKTGKTQPGGLWIAPYVQLAPAAESYNLLALGTHGSGKSSLLRALVEQVIDRGDRLFVHDVKGDMTSGLPIRSAILVAPHDRRSWAYDVAADIRNIQQAREFCKRLVKEDENDAMWGRGAGAISTDLIMGLIGEKGDKWGWSDLAKSLLVPGVEMKARLDALGSLNASRLIFGSADPEENRTTMSLLITLWIAATTMVLPLAEAWAEVPRRRRFSLRKWVANEGKLPKTLVLQRSAEYASLSTMLGGFLLDRLLGLVMAPTGERNRHEKLVLCLDEFPELGRVERLPNALNVGRELGLVTLGGLQDIAHLFEIYGEQIAQVLLARFRVKLIHQLDPGDTVDRVMKMLGERTIVTKSETETHPTTGKALLVTRTEPVFGLQQFETELGVRTENGVMLARMMVLGLGNPAVLDVPVTGWPDRRPAHVPATWLDRITDPDNPENSRQQKRQPQLT